MKLLLPIGIAFVSLSWMGAQAASEAFELTGANFDQRPGGGEADAIVGDIVLRNDVIEAVISGDLPLRRANMGTFYGEGGTTPGCLYDFCLRGSANDELTIWTPCNQKGEDAHLIVVAFGEDLDLRGGHGTSPNGALPPCAYNNPIFVDTDGEGFQVNNDTLGWDLPDKSISVDRALELLGQKVVPVELQ